MGCRLSSLKQPRRTRGREPEQGFLFTQLFAFIKTPSHLLYFSLKGSSVSGAINDVVAYTRGARSLAETVNPRFVETGDPDSN